MAGIAPGHVRDAMLAWIDAGCDYTAATFEDAAGRERSVDWLLRQLSGCTNVMPTIAVRQLNRRLLEAFDRELSRGATYGEAVERVGELRDQKQAGARA